ncbi:MAG: Fe(2+)-trafficking protein [Phycisphaerae bacterium]|jgi:Fe-S cluster biosynthesis and repair protein YggX
MDESRIEQFRKMAEADPENELGHLSLGRALVEAKRCAEAVPPLRKALALNPNNSRGYQLLAAALKETGEKSEALAVLRKGFEVAHARGDLMPRNEIAAMLRELGEEPPAVTAGGAPPAPAAAAGSGQIVCKRCGRTQPRMAARPFKGPLGEQVWAGICQPCWTEWIHMGTKVINELRLNFAIPKHAEIYDQHLREFLNLEQPAG